MGKNAKRRREAKLQEKLKHPTSASDGSYEDLSDATLMPLEKDSPLPVVFRTEAHEEITDDLVTELVNKKGWKEVDLLESKKLGMKYCRERNSLISPPESFGDD